MHEGANVRSTFTFFGPSQIYSFSSRSIWISDTRDCVLITCKKLYSVRQICLTVFADAVSEADKLRVFFQIDRENPQNPLDNLRILDRVAFA